MRQSSCARGGSPWRARAPMAFRAGVHTRRARASELEPASRGSDAASSDGGNHGDRGDLGPNATEEGMHASEAMATSPVRIVSFNVNGLRVLPTRRREPLKQILDATDADIVCFQETKLARGIGVFDETSPSSRATNRTGHAAGRASRLPLGCADHARPRGRVAFSSVRPGYSGVATYVRLAATSVLPVDAGEGLAGCHVVNAARRRRGPASC